LSQAPSSLKSHRWFVTDDGCSIEQASAKAIFLLAHIKLLRFTQAYGQGGDRRQRLGIREVHPF
ncbi:MAG: hypothetical protein VXZ53_03815, partial [Planctomycetota bacterium]|nr:hypothetical protein [Planctomycetota bacterium]